MNWYLAFLLLHFIWLQAQYFNIWDMLELKIEFVEFCSYLQQRLAFCEKHHKIRLFIPFPIMLIDWIFLIDWDEWGRAIITNAFFDHLYSMKAMKENVMN